MFSGDDGAKVAREGGSPTRRVRREETFKYVFPNLTLISRGDERLSARRAERRHGFGRTPRGRHRDGRRAVRRRPYPSRRRRPREEKPSYLQRLFGVSSASASPPRAEASPEEPGTPPETPESSAAATLCAPVGAARGARATRAESHRRESGFPRREVASLTRRLADADAEVDALRRQLAAAVAQMEAREELVRAREAQLASAARRRRRSARNSENASAPCRGSPRRRRGETRAPRRWRRRRKI